MPKFLLFWPSSDDDGGGGGSNPAVSWTAVRTLRISYE